MYLDAESGQLITFEPTQMSITGPCRSSNARGYIASLTDPVQVGDRFIGTITYHAEMGHERARAGRHGVIVQDDPDQPIRLLQDNRVPAVGRSFVDAAGDFYALADAGGNWPGLTGL